MVKTPEQSHASLERELRRLSEKYSWDEAPPSVKQRIRTIKNRLSAQRSREQARKYVEQLEGTVKELAEESDILARRLEEVPFPPLHPKASSPTWTGVDGSMNTRFIS